MALNQVQQSGNMFECPVTSGYSAGDPDLVGGYAALTNADSGLPCVLLTDADASDRAIIACDGVFRLSVTSSSALVVGDGVFLDSADGVLKPYDSSNGTLVLFGWLLEAHGGTGAESVKVRINNSGSKLYAQTQDIFLATVTQTNAGTPDIVGGYGNLLNPVYGLPCVLLADAAAGVALVSTNGVFTLDVVVDGGNDMQPGEPVFIDTTDGTLNDFDDADANLALFGWLMEEALNGATRTVSVRLNNSGCVMYPTVV